MPLYGKRVLRFTERELALVDAVSFLVLAADRVDAAAWPVGEERAQCPSPSFSFMFRRTRGTSAVPSTTGMLLIHVPPTPRRLLNDGVLPWKLSND